MSKEKYDDLAAKYFAAESTLEEEAKLFNAKNRHSETDAWSTFVNQKKKGAPPELKDTIRRAIQTRKRRKQRFLVRLSGVAASIVLFITFFFYYTGYKRTEYKEKEALLNEALSMFPDEKNTSARQKIIYEDEMIIIYTASN